jgi:hypothetical protein
MTTTRTRAAEANDALTRALINAAAKGLRPRCGDYETSHLWLSEIAACPGVRLGLDHSPRQNVKLCRIVDLGRRSCQPLS